MKRELLLSFLLHICGISIYPLITFWQKKPSYPVSVYQVSLQSLQTPQPSTQLTGQRKVRRKRKSKKAERKETRSKRASPYKGKISTQGGEFKYSYYLDIILSRISENWRNPYEGEGGKISAVVYFIIKRNGEIDKIRLEKSSRNYYFDQSALRAVHATKKLPPLPEEFNRGWLGVYFEFEYIQ